MIPPISSYFSSYSDLSYLLGRSPDSEATDDFVPALADGQSTLPAHEACPLSAVPTLPSYFSKDAVNAARIVNPLPAAPTPIMTKFKYCNGCNGPRSVQNERYRVFAKKKMETMMNSSSFKASFVSRHKARRRHIVQDSPPQQLIVFLRRMTNGARRRRLRTKLRGAAGGEAPPSFSSFLDHRDFAFSAFGRAGTCSSANFAFSFCNEMGGALHPSSGSNKFFDLAASQSMQHIRCTFPSRCTTGITYASGRSV